MRVGLFVPCFVDALYPQVGIATVQVLEQLGVDLDYPAEQTCCGQPQFNAGLRDEAKALAERFCRIFAPYDAVVTPSGSCAAMARVHFPSLIGDDPVCARVFELCEFIVAQTGSARPRARLDGRAVLHVGCHALRELGAADAVRKLMKSVDGLTLVDVDSESWCCGFGGTFAVKFPEISSAMGRRKLAPVLGEKVDYLISTDSSCLMHLAGLLSRQQATAPRPMHVAEVLTAGSVAP